MATRYWRGGTGTWGTGTGNWADTPTATTFTASRSGTTLTVTGTPSGTIAVGQTVWHTNGTAIGTITGFGTGSGGAGTYTTSLSGALSSRTMSSATVGASAPSSSDDVVFDSNSNVGTATFTVTESGATNCRNLTISGLDAVMTFAGGGSLAVAGSLAFPASNLTNSYTGSISFNAASSATITTNGVALASDLFVQGAGPFTLGSALSTTGNLTIVSGVTFNSANYSIASAIPVFNLAATVSLGTSSYSVTPASGGINAYLGGVTGGTFTFNLNTSSANSSITGTGLSINGVVIAGSGSGTTFTFLGSSNNVGYTNNWGAVSSTKTVAHTVKFEEPNILFFAEGVSPLVQHNFTNFNLSGTAGNQLTLTYATGVDGSQNPAKLVQTSGTVSVSYDTISKLNVSGGASWQAYSNNGNVNGGSNTGWQFSFATSGTGTLTGTAASVSGLANKSLFTFRGDASGIASASGDLLLTRLLQGDAFGEAATFGALDIQVALSGNVFSISDTNGNLTLAVFLDSQALMQADAFGDLLRGVFIEAAVFAQVSATDSGGIVINKPLFGLSETEMFATGILSGQLFFGYIFVVPSEDNRLYVMAEDTKMTVPFEL